MKYIGFLGVLFGLMVGTAQAAENYTSIINVDVTDTNASTAKERAMAQANRRAVYNIAPEFTDERGMALLETLTSEQILYFIKEATVLDEKSSDVRYIASLKISVYGDILQQYLQEKGLAEQLQISEINIIYLFPDLSDWLKTEQTIKTMKNVEYIETVAMSKQKVQFKVFFRGSSESFIASAGLNGLNLSISGNIYMMSKQNKVPVIEATAPDTEFAATKTESGFEETQHESGEYGNAGTQY